MYLKAVTLSIFCGNSIGVAFNIFIQQTRTKTRLSQQQKGPLEIFAKIAAKFKNSLLIEVRSFQPCCAPR